MRVQRTRHTRAFVQIPNRIAQNHSLSLEARGLLTYLLSLPDANRATVERITALVPNGRRTVSNAMNELEASGHLRRARVQDPENGRWVTLTSITDSPTDHMPTVGEPTGQVVGGSPIGSKTESKKDTTPPPNLPQEPAQLAPEGTKEGGKGESAYLKKIEREMAREGRRILERLSLHKSLPLTDQEIARLTPRVTPWLREGFSSTEILQCLTAGLPEHIDSVPALISHRLKSRTPVRSAPQKTSQPVERAHCEVEVCGRIFPLGHPGGICRDCQAEMDRATALLGAGL
ncbi:hypothetical protein [Streptomyces sp. NPDC004682]